MRFGLPAPGLPTTPGVAFDVIAAATAAGSAPGFPSKNSPATPATCGADIDVPLIVAVAVFDVYQAAVMLSPGANRSTQVPKLEDVFRASLIFVQPTVIPEGSPPGEKLQASAPLLPADLTQRLIDTEVNLLSAALEKARFNQRMAADLLGLSYHQFRGKLRKFDIRSKP